MGRALICDRYHRSVTAYVTMCALTNEEGLMRFTEAEELPLPLGPARGVYYSVVIGSGMWGVLLVAAAWVRVALV